MDLDNLGTLIRKASQVEIFSTSECVTDQPSKILDDLGFSRLKLICFRLFKQKLNSDSP